MFAWRKNSVWVLLVITFSISLLLAGIVAGADRIRVAKGGYSPSTPPYFTYAAPFLLKQDIVVEDVLMSSGSLADQALSSGDIKVLLTTGSIAMQANLAGGDLVIIAGAVHRLPYQIVARPEIKTAADLKGKLVGISRFGSSSESIVRFGLAKLGLAPDRDFSIVQIGGTGDRYLALQNNTIQATVLAPPLTNAAVQKGMKELIDVSKLDLLYPLESVTTTRGFLQSNRSLLKRFLMGLSTALYNYQNDPESGIAFQAKQFKFAREQAEIAYHASARVVHTDLRLPDAAVLDSAMKEIAARMDKARGMNPADLKVVDGSLRQELANEGFFDRFKKPR
jgi:ABC-type nitrate/sulfonate/bicarbonate transport system substrate-binding protein